MKQQDILIRDFQSINPELTKEFKNKTIVITGATGFIGSLLARYFLWANDEYKLNSHLILVVRSIDKLYLTIPNAVNNPAVSIHNADFSKPCHPITQPFDYLVHTAAVTTSALMVKRPISVMDISLNGTRWALESTRLNPKSRMLYLSSMEVYGSFTDGRTVVENDLGMINLSSPRSCYPESKRMCELMCTLYNTEFQTNTFVARLAQTFGAGILPEENRVFRQFADSAIADSPIILHTDGLSDGNYVYSSDALNAILTLLIRAEVGEAYNVANEKCHTTIRDMAQMVVDTFGKENMHLVIESQDASRFGYAAPTKMVLSSQKLRSLGWNPQKNLTKAYRLLIDFLIATKN